MKAKPIRKKTQYRNVRLLWFSVGGVIIMLGIWAAYNLLKTVAPATDIGAQPGQVAPDFTVPTLDGATFTLSEQRGKPTIIYFTAYWCGTCIPKAQELGQLYQEYVGRVNIIALDVDPTSTPELLDRFKQAAGNGAFVWAFDSDSKVATAYRINYLSTLIILDSKGQIIYRGQFPTSYAALKGELEKLIQ